MRDHLHKIGATLGLARPRPGERPAESPTVDYDPEQVLVFTDTDAVDWTDLDGHTHPARRIVLEGWLGYGIPARLHLTEAQASGLATLLALAGQGATRANIVAARAAADADRELFDEMVDLAQRARTRHQEMRRLQDALVTLIPEETSDDDDTH